MPLVLLCSIGLMTTGCASTAGDDGGGTTVSAPSTPTALSDAAIAYEPVVVAPPIDLIRPDGSTFELADAKGSPLLVFFGYTHCPDVCPTTFGTLISVIRERPDAKVAFITIDPERDTREWLAGWTDLLPEQVTGLTGSPALIRSVADAYGARFARGEELERGYLMVHSADVYLIDDAGRLLARYPFGTEADEILADLATAVPRRNPPPSANTAG